MEAATEEVGSCCEMNNFFNNCGGKIESEVLSEISLRFYQNAVNSFIAGNEEFGNEIQILDSIKYRCLSLVFIVFVLLQV